MKAGDIVRLVVDTDPRPLLFKVHKLLPAREWWKGEVAPAVSCRPLNAKRGAAGYTFRLTDVVRAQPTPPPGRKDAGARTRE